MRHWASCAKAAWRTVSRASPAGMKPKSSWLGSIPTTQDKQPMSQAVGPAAPRSNAEADIRRSEERIRLASSNETMILFEQDMQLRYTWLHPAPAQNILGLTEAQLQ